MRRARFRHGGWRGLFQAERVSRRSGDPRPLSSCSCHLRRCFEYPFLARQICCGQSPRRLVVGNERLQKKSTLTGGGSGGDPPTVKSERRLGNSRQELRNSTRECERERGGIQGVRKDLLALLPSPIYIVERGMAPSLMVLTIEGLSTH